jgi:hypothetical protein
MAGQFLPSGRIRTPAGGTRTRGGALALNSQLGAGLRTNRADALARRAGRAALAQANTSAIITGRARTGGGGGGGDASSGSSTRRSRGATGGAATTNPTSNALRRDLRRGLVRAQPRTTRPRAATVRTAPVGSRPRTGRAANRGRGRV